MVPQRRAAGRTVRPSRPGVRGGRGFYHTPAVLQTGRARRGASADGFGAGEKDGDRLFGGEGGGVEAEVVRGGVAPLAVGEVVVERRAAAVGGAKGAAGAVGREGAQLGHAGDARLGGGAEEDAEDAGAVGEQIAQRILSGETAAVVTDAGMPCISDPGELLVKRCAELGVEVKVVPGPTAAMSAIAISGLSTQNFSFRGFLSVNKKQRQAHLASIRDCTDTLIFYEAPHKLEATLSDLLAFLGDRRVSLCRELTKIHEEVRRTTLSEAVEYYKTNKPKGEFVLVIEGARAEEYENTDSIEAALAQVAALAEKGMRPADACREIAKVSPFSKGELYTAYLEGKDDA